MSKVIANSQGKVLTQGGKLFLANEGGTSSPQPVPVDITRYNWNVSGGNRCHLLIPIPHPEYPISITITNAAQTATPYYRCAFVVKNGYIPGSTSLYDGGWVSPGNTYTNTGTWSTAVCVDIIFSWSNSANAEQDFTLADALRYITIDLRWYDYPYNVDKTPKPTARRVTNLVAHQGVWHNVTIPANSRYSMMEAARSGFRFVETDVQTTSDGELVLMHGDAINSTMRDTNYQPLSSTIYIKDKTLAELQSGYVYIGGENMRGSITTFEEFLRICTTFNLFPIIEIKANADGYSANSANSDATAKQVLSMANNALGPGRFAITSYYDHILDLARTLDPNVLLLYMTTQISGTFNSIDNTPRCNPKNVMYNAYSVQYPARISNYHMAGQLAGAYTVPVSKYQKMVNDGIDFLVTDDIRPIPDNAPVLDSYYSPSEITTTGTLSGHKFNLETGQSITIVTPALKWGGYRIEFNVTGAVTIVAPNLSDSVAATSETMKIYQGSAAATGAITITITATAATTVNQLVVRYCDYCGVL